MFVYKKLKASDASITAFEAHKSYTTQGSLYLGRYNSSSKDIFSQFNLNNELEYFQLDHTFYRNAPFQLGNLNGGLNYINQEKRLYDKAVIISLPQNEFGDGLQKGQITINNNAYKDDSKGNIYKSTETISDYPKDEERVLYVGPVKGFQRTDLTRDLKTGRLLTNPPSEYSDTQVDDSLYVNPVIYDSASIVHFPEINCTAIDLPGGPVKVLNSNHYNFNNDDFTISFYYKSSNQTEGNIIDKGFFQSTIPYPNSNGSGAPTEYGSQVSTEKVVSKPFEITVGADVTFRRVDIDGTEASYTAGTITADALHHIACVKTGSHLQIWIDGVKQGNDGVDTTTICRNKADVTIGRSNRPGKVSQIMIWNKGLSSTEISNVSESIDGTPYIGNVFYENGIVTFTSPKYNDNFHTITTEDVDLTLNATEWIEGNTTKRDINFNTFIKDLTFINRENNIHNQSYTNGSSPTDSNLRLLQFIASNFADGTSTPGPQIAQITTGNNKAGLKAAERIQRDIPFHLNPITSSLTHTYTTYGDFSPIFDIISGSEGTASGELGQDGDSHLIFKSNFTGIRLELGENQTVTESINILMVSNSQEITNEDFYDYGTNVPIEDYNFSINPGIYTGTEYQELFLDRGLYIYTDTPEGFESFPWYSGSMRQNFSTTITNELEGNGEKFTFINYNVPAGTTEGAAYSKNTLGGLGPGKIEVLEVPDGGFSITDPFFLKVGISGSLGDNFGQNFNDSLTTKIHVYVNSSLQTTKTLTGFAALTNTGQETIIQFPPANAPNGFGPSVGDKFHIALEFDYIGQSWPVAGSEYTIYHFGAYQDSTQSPYVNYLEAKTTIDTKLSSVYYITCSQIAPNGLDPSSDSGYNASWVNGTSNQGLNTDVNGDTLGVKALLWSRINGTGNYTLLTQSFYPSGAYADNLTNNFHYEHGPTDDEDSEQLIFQIVADTAENEIPDNSTVSSLNNLTTETGWDYPIAALPDGASMGISGSFIVTEVSASNVLHLETALSDKFTSSLNFTSSVLIDDFSTQLGGYSQATASIVGFISDDGTKIQLSENNLYFSTSSFSATASLDRGNYISGSASISIPEDDYGIYFVENVTLRNPAAGSGIVKLDNGQQNVKVICKVNGEESGSRVFDTSTYGNVAVGRNVFEGASNLELGPLNSDDNVSFEFQVVTSSNDTDLSLVEKYQGFYVTDIQLRRITSSATLSREDGGVFTFQDSVDYIQFLSPHSTATHTEIPFYNFVDNGIAGDTLIPTLNSTESIVGYSDDGLEAYLESPIFITQSLNNDISDSHVVKAFDVGPFQVWRYIYDESDNAQISLKAGKEYDIRFTGSVEVQGDTEANTGAAIRVRDGIGGNILSEIYTEGSSINANLLDIDNYRVTNDTELWIQLLISGAASDLYPTGEVTSSIVGGWNLSLRLHAVSGSKISSETVTEAEFLAATESSPADEYSWVGEGVNGDYEVQGSTPTSTLLIDSPHNSYSGIAPALSTGEITINGVTRLSNGKLEVATPLFITASAPTSGTAPTHILVLDDLSSVPVNPFTIDETPFDGLLGFTFDYTNPVDNEVETLTITAIDEDNNTITVNNGQGLYQVGTYNAQNDQSVTVTTSSLSFNAGFGKVSFRNTHPIFENEYHCTVDENEFNFTLNPTVRKQKSIDHGELANFATGSNFKPYVTTIGLYNDQGDLLVVGKTSQAVRMSDETDTTFVVKFDT